MREVDITLESWPTRAPFSITGYRFTEANVLVVTLKQDGKCGRGEATGVYYLNETGDSLLAQAQSLHQALEQGLDRKTLQQLLPAGGARNAIDCALWDLEAKLTGKSIWQQTDITPKAVVTVNTVGIGSPEKMAAEARKLNSPKLKVKLDGEQPLACIQAVCAARPDAEIVVDVNQGWSFEQLVTLAPQFKALGITMIEQPLPRGMDSQLDDYMPPLPLCADESCLDTSELDQAAKRYQMINIKLDKTGGLTEALALAKAAKAKGLGLMVGNMLGTSLAMAPGFVIAQFCQLADLDGPLLLAQDRTFGMQFRQGEISVPKSELWG